MALPKDNKLTPPLSGFNMFLKEYFEQEKADVAKGGKPRDPKEMRREAEIAWEAFKPEDKEMFWPTEQEKSDSGFKNFLKEYLEQEKADVAKGGKPRDPKEVRRDAEIAWEAFEQFEPEFKQMFWPSEEKDDVDMDIDMDQDDAGCSDEEAEDGGGGDEEFELGVED